MINQLPPDPPLTIAFLAAFVTRSRWMRRHRDWKKRLLYRLAKEHLDMLTRQAIATDMVEQETKWASRVRK